MFSPIRGKRTSRSLNHPRPEVAADGGQHICLCWADSNCTCRLRKFIAEDTGKWANVVKFSGANSSFTSGDALDTFRRKWPGDDPYEDASGINSARNGSHPEGGVAKRSTAPLR